ncbi:unnamed protein product [Pieris macdunnoughi]|uniref:TIL domain-containing protein n=1 Tax=Pieris macdunnoughi TaxID=345717 RepID=A0A821NEI7_9NEOP|nr:unnamed protein product [Pieris macdunnoughi]
MANVMPLLFLCLVATALASGDTAKVCPENEVFVECKLATCWKTCQELKNRGPCPSIAAGCVDPGCVCISDYLRNDEGICVKYEECCEYSRSLVTFDLDT